MIVGTYLKQYSEGDRVFKSTYIGQFADRHQLLCDCGKLFSVKHRNRLKNSGNFMCKNCYAVRDSLNHNTDWGARAALKRIKHDAKLCGREFEIDLDFFIDLSQKPCFYCGGSPSNEIRYQPKLAGATQRVFRYSGMDRVDNNIGYTTENVVPCCIICNRAKRDLSFEDFMVWINRIRGLDEKEK